MAQPEISVVIPAFNEEKYLAVSLNSFSKQTFRDFELIVSDGGSTDKTQKIALYHHAKFITVKNSNVVRARDAGLRIAKGKILVGADADTYYQPDHLENISREFKKNDKVDAVTGRARMVNGPVWGETTWKLLYRI